MHKLAGMRVNPATNGQHGRRGATSPRLVRVEDGRQVSYGLRLDDLIKDGDITANFPIAPGDVLIIPEAWF